MEYKVTIKNGKEKQLLNHHPWVFSGAIENITPEYAEAGFASVYTSEGRFIAKGYYDEKSHIILHLLSWNEKDVMGEEFIKKLFKESILRRSEFFSEASTTNAIRLCHSEADFIPGLVADAYASRVKLVISSRFAYSFLQSFVDVIEALLKPSLIIATTDKEYASAEGLSEKIRFFKSGKEVKLDEGKIEPVRILEGGIYYEIPALRGQKSGFYIDQRENRILSERYAKDKVCLDVCSYTGGFTLHLLKAGAKKVKAIDSSESALRHLLFQVHLNEEKKTIKEDSRDKVEILSGDAFELIRAEERNKYDLIILDPPKLAKTKGKLDDALRAYKDLNRVAMEKIKNGGIIFTFSCSAALKPEDFKKMISWSAKDAKVETQILRVLSQSEDHPIRASFPESEYLKGLVIRIIK